MKLCQLKVNVYTLNKLLISLTISTFLRASCLKKNSNIKINDDKDHFHSLQNKKDLEFIKLYEFKVDISRYC
jgi:hypothetical protein